MSEDDRLAQAVELVKAGNRAEAQKILAQIILTNKDNARAWMLMARITDDPKRAMQCWQQVARLRPDDLRVLREMARLNGETLSQVPTQTRLPAVPSFEPDVLPRKQSSQPFMPWLIGGTAVLVLVICGAALALANARASSATNQQAMLTPGTLTTTTMPEDIHSTGTPITVTASAAEQSITPTVSASETATQQGLNLLTVAPPRATAVATSGTSTATPKTTATARTKTPLTTTTQPTTPPPTTPPPTTPPPTTPPPTTPPPTTPPPTTPPPNVVRPGTYLVGPGIEVGIYRGQAPSNSTCYWARLDDQSEVLAERNSIGQFYVEVRSTDYAFRTDCELIPLESVSPNPGGAPTSIPPGTYLIGRDIPAGTYNGTAEGAGCYWELLSDVAGELDSIIVNDFITAGAFSVDVTASDFALLTECPLQR